jgi:hypothetical protein
MYELFANTSYVVIRATPPQNTSRNLVSSSIVTSSSNTMTITLMPVFEKLVHDNHIVWKAQVLAALQGAQLASFLDGSNEVLAAKMKIKVSKETTEDAKKYLTRHTIYGERRNRRS